MINTRDFSFIRCHRASKAPHEAGRASKPTPSIGYPITLLIMERNDSMHTSGDASIIVLGEGNALDRADSGRIFPSSFRSIFFSFFLFSFFLVFFYHEVLLSIIFYNI